MTNINHQRIYHPIFDSYRNQENLQNKENRITNFFEELSEMSDSEKLAFLKGESYDIISDLEDYVGNVSTSQLKNIDYSKFSNHVFFDSAVHKVKYAFDELIQFPYDAKEIKYYEYITNLDGYTKYVLENIYPKYTGHIELKNEVKIVIKDRKGFLLNDDITNKITEGVLSPVSSKGFTFSFHVNTPSLSNLDSHNNQTLFKKTIVNQDDKVLEGYFCYFEKIQNESEYCYLVTCIIKNQKQFLKKCKVPLLSKEYINIVVYKSIENNFEIDYYVNSEKTDSINEGQKITYELFSEEFAKKDVEFIIGDGESNNFIADNNTNIILGSFSGKIDEFIFFNKKRNETDIRLYRDQNIFTDSSVLLYLKFNEIGGSHANCDLIVDASGNKLHGVLLNVSDNSRITNTSSYKVSDITNPTFLKNEDLEKNPIILGSVSLIEEKRNEFIAKGSKYDSANSNLIFNLIPSHYFSESSNYEETPDYINNQINESDSLSSSTKSSNSHLTQICLIWARFFDQLKLYVDAISGVFNLSYEDVNEQKFVNAQMEILCKLYGFDFVEIDLNRSLEKSEKKNITFDDVKDDIGIVKLQNMIWKKILLNSQDIIRSKGTRNCINSFINTLGFDIKKYAYIEEKSYQNYVNLEDSFETSSLEICELNFTKFLGNNISYNNSNRIKNHPHALISNIRSVNNEGSVIAGFQEDCTFEVFFNLNKSNKEYNNKQTIFQLISNVESANFCWGIVHLDFKNSKSNFCDIVLDISPFVSSTGLAQNNVKQVRLEKINLFDVSHYVSLNFKKDSTQQKLTVTLNYNTIGDVTDLNRIKSSKIEYTVNQEESLYINNAFDLSIGHNNYTNMADQIFDSNLLNDNGFEGSVYNIKIWKKSLSNLEMLKHSKDILSISEEKLEIKKRNLVSNFYFNDILNISVDKDNTFAIYSPDSYFPYVDRNPAGNEINYCIVTLNFDEGVNVSEPVFLNRIIRKTNSGSIDKIDSNNLNRVRILSFEDEENKNAYNNYEIYPTNDYPIDYESLNTDFITISISSSKSINNAFERLINRIENITDLITSNQKIYDYSYLDIEHLRHEFFENYDDSMYFDYDNLNNIFKYFDNIMNSVLLSLIPSDVTFKGFNLVYESHILERAKYQYKNKESNVSVHASDELFTQTRFDPCKSISKRSTNYNNNRKLAE